LRIFQAHTADEIEQAKVLFQEYADQLGVDLCFQGFTQELAGLPGSYALPMGRLLLATEGERWVGCGAMRPFTESICEMKRLYVRDSFRGLRAGRKLAEALIFAAREVGYQKMRLDTLPSMKEAQALYRSLGFYEIDSYRENPIEGTLYMELSLQSL
jgi:ribosomal protein S18 acetylase RimI-like enzyme